ncbi:MAG: M3 family oligoendopeptidase [Candidatus Eremiobacteraeota bacterium]|nr:M3 family oligoendopeptidase [Candidatus Eremiobacteraeota bacterium]
MATVLTPNTGDWDLTPYYPERLGAAYQKDRQDFRTGLDQALQETDLVKLLIQWEKLVSDSEHMGSYLNCLRSADGRDQQVGQDLASLQSDCSRMRQLEVNLGEQLKALSEAQLAELFQNAQLQDLDYYLKRLRQRALWQMPSELENLAADLDVDGMSAWGRLYDQVAGRLEFQYQNSEGETITKPMSMKVSLLEDPDPKVRKSVLDGSNRAWQGVEDVAAACLNAIAGTRLTLYKRRGIPHFLEPALFDSAIERATLDSMLGAIASRYDLPRRFLKLKAQILGVQQLGFQDLSAPLPELDNSKIAWEQAGKMLVEETRASYPEFSKFCQESLAKKWVDWSPREGKRPGGYCTGSTRLRESRIFMTYHGAFGDLMTLTHEFGHAWHSHVMHQERPLNTLYPMTLAETASTFAENLLLDALLRAPATTPEQRLKLLDSRLEAAAAFLLNIPSRFLFEKRFYEERAEGEVSVDRLKELMVEAQKEAYGDSLDPEQLDPYFWASKLHFYITEVSFYNFPYSFGYLFSLGVYAQSQKRGEAFLPTYERLLQATGRRTAEECARENLQVELNQPQFWLDSLALVEEDMRQFEELAREVYKIA